MKMRHLLLLFIAPVLFAGCVINDAGSEKTLVIKKDSSGNITGVTESKDDKWAGKNPSLYNNPASPAIDEQAAKKNRKPILK